MRIASIGIKPYGNNNIQLNSYNKNPQIQQSNTIQKKYSQLPYSFKYNANVSFGEFFDPNRTVPHIDYEEYMAMSESTKKDLEKDMINFLELKQPN